MRVEIKKYYLTIRGICLRALGHIIPQASKTLPDIRQIKRVLFVRIDRIGDMVLSTPVFKSLKAANPLLEITILASSGNSPLLVNNPNVDHMISYNPAKGLQSLLSVIGKLRNNKFDLAIDPYDNYRLTSALIVFLSGAKWRVGYSCYGREIFFNIKVERPPDDTHFIDVVLNSIEPLGIATKDRVPEIFITKDEEKKGREWLAQTGIENKPIVGIHPGAYYESQRWPTEYYADFIVRLRENRDFEAILFGGPSDSSVINHIKSRLNGKIPICEDKDLRRVLALISECKLFICNNSGPLHMAAALGVPTISFMGPSQKVRWWPAGEKHIVLRVDDLPCIGCNSGQCKIGTHNCMDQITPETVLNMVRNLLKEKRKNHESKIVFG